MLSTGCRKTAPGNPNPEMIKDDGRQPRRPAGFLRHILVLGGLLVIARFLIVPYLERFERLPGESELRSIRLPAESDELRCWIDLAEAVGKGAVEIFGWAFIQGEDSPGQETYVVLELGGLMRVFSAEAQIRPDVTEYFEETQLDLDWSGFRALIPAGKIGNGVHRLGVYVRKTGRTTGNGEREALAFTDWVVRKERNSLEVFR